MEIDHLRQEQYERIQKVETLQNEVVRVSDIIRVKITEIKKTSQLATKQVQSGVTA